MYFVTGYAETLLAPLTMAFFWALQRQRFLLASALAAAAIFTRSTAVVLLAPLAVVACAPLVDPAGKPVGRALAESAGRLAVGYAVAGLGVAGFALVQAFEVGKPFAFLEAYAAWVRLEWVDHRVWLLQGPTQGLLQYLMTDHKAALGGLVFFVAAPFLVIAARRCYPPSWLAWVLAALLFFTLEDNHDHPFLNMLRWTAILFPVHVAFVAITARRGRSGGVLFWSVFVGGAGLWAICAWRFALMRWVS
jgi:hypothetical protein